MISFLVLTFVALVFFGFELRGVSDRTSRMMLYLTSGSIFVLVGFNRFNPDYKGYSGSFYNGNDNLEIGYRLLNGLLHTLNLPFESIIFLVGLLVLTALLVVANSNYNQLIVLGYLIFPLAFDLPQLRNTIMYLLVVVAFVLFRNKQRIYLVMSVILSATMHVLGVLYLPLAFLIKLDRKRFYRYLEILFGILVIGAISLRILTAVTPLPEAIREEIDPFEWFYFAIQVLHASLELLTYVWIERKLSKYQTAINDTKLETFYRFGLYSILYLPLVAVSTEMYRFRRNAQLIKYAYSAASMKYLDKQERIVLLGIVGLNLLLTLGMMVIAGDLYVYQYFDKNFFFNSFIS